MTRYLGDFPTGATIDFKWDSFGGGGQSITRATDGSIRIYKDNSATQRTSANGITDTEDFDSVTGVHHLRIDLSDNTDSGFYAAGHEYQIVLVGAVIDGQTVNAVLAEFSIERANGILALLKSGTFGLSALNTTLGTIAGYVDTEVAAIKAKTDNLPASPAATSDIAAALGTALTESYRANGAAGSVAELLYEILALLGEKSVVGTTLTTKKVDRSTVAATYTLNDASSPTSITRAS